jgi:hypothetical protein
VVAQLQTAVRISRPVRVAMWSALMFVDGVREVVVWQPRGLVGGLEDDRVIAVDLVLELAPDGVGEPRPRTLGEVGGPEQHDIGDAFREVAATDSEVASRQMAQLPPLWEAMSRSIVAM